MSVSEAVQDIRARLASEAPLSQADVSALLADAVRLYVEVSTDPYGDEALGGLQVTPTEACTVATALLHAQSLSPFEFSVWFSSSGR